MSMNSDALKILTVLYNYKIKGINDVRSDDTAIKDLKLSDIEFNNAREFLCEKKFAKVYGHLTMSNLISSDIFEESEQTTKEELEENAKYEYEKNIKSLKIQVKGTDVIEKDKKIHSTFGYNILKKVAADGTITIVDNSVHISNPNVNNVTHEHTGDINYGNITHTNLTLDNSKKYTIDKVDMSTHEKYSIAITNKYGEKKPLIVSTVSFIAGIFTIITGMASLLPEINVQFFPWIPVWLLVSNNFAPYLTIIGVLLVIFGGYLFSLIQYKYESQCLKCKKHYTMKEFGEAQVCDVETKEGIRRTITRNYKCNNCGFEKLIKNNELIPNSELEE